jgi:hypothetical protein
MHMATLYALGASAPHYFSKCGISVKQSDAWMTAPAPDVPHTHILHAVRNSTGVTLMATNAGGVITTTDFTSYVAYHMDDQQSQFVKVGWRDVFVSVGFKRDAHLREQAHIWMSGNAFDQYSWQARFAVFDDYSAFTHLCVTTGNNWIAVGHAQNLTESLFVMGSTLSSWNQITLPASLQGGIWSIAHDAGRVWVGGRGWVATTLVNNWNSWVKTDLGVPHTVTDILIQNGVVHVLAGDSLFYSDNQFDYERVQLPGRTLTCAHVHEGDLYVGSHSLLTQSDVFVWNSDSHELMGNRSNTHAYAFVTV